MTLQEQVCTLEQAQRLKELGCEQEAYFGWFKFYKLSDEWSLAQNIFTNRHNCKDFLRAFTVAELGEMLIKLGRYEMPAQHKGTWYHKYLGEPKKYTCILFATEAQARAALLIHILEQEKKHELSH